MAANDRRHTDASQPELARRDGETMRLDKCHMFSFSTETIARFRPATKATVAGDLADLAPAQVVLHPATGRGTSASKAEHAGVIVLQLPHGTPQYYEDILQAINDRTSTLCGHIERLAHSNAEPALQCALALLERCAAPRLGHALRAICPSITLRPTVLHDMRIICCLSRAMGRDAHHPAPPEDSCPSARNRRPAGPSSLR